MRTGTPRNAGDDPVRVRRRRLKIVPKSIEEEASRFSEVKLTACALCSANSNTISRTSTCVPRRSFSLSLSLPPRSVRSRSRSLAHLVSSHLTSRRVIAPVSASLSPFFRGVQRFQECDGARPRERQVFRVRGFSCQEATGAATGVTAAMGVVNRGVVSR